MHIKKHADKTEELYGFRAEDIHEWIDQHFDHYRFRLSQRLGYTGGWDPYDHRKILHHRGALPDALEEFRGKYPEDIIEKVFFQHIKDDYDGYIPEPGDFDDPDFLRRYHGRS